MQATSLVNVERKMKLGVHECCRRHLTDEKNEKLVWQVGEEDKKVMIKEDEMVQEQVRKGDEARDETVTNIVTNITLDPIASVGGEVGELVEESGKLLELLAPADAEAVVGLLTQVDRCSSPVARALHAQIGGLPKVQGQGAEGGFVRRRETRVSLDEGERGGRGL